MWHTVISTGGAKDSSSAKSKKKPSADEPQWMKTVQSLILSEFANAKPDLSMPPSTLTLEWVHGYRAGDCKNNVRRAAPRHAMSAPAAR